MTSRERIIAAINHKEPDRVPVDLGSTTITGIHALALANLRKAWGIVTDRPVKVFEVLQQLGMVEPEDIKALGVDTAMVVPYKNKTGVTNDAWKKYEDNPFGIDALCAADFNVTKTPDGRRYAYPEGDMSARPSMVMPDGGYFFDNINRTPDTLDDEDLDPRKDFKDSSGVMSDEEARFYEKQANDLFAGTDLALVGNLSPASFGDVANIPGTNLKNPRGLRDLPDWMMAHKLRPDYIEAVFDMQLEVALKNLEIYKQAVGEKIQVILMGGTDFGSQMAPMISNEDFRAMYFPYWKKANDWVHQNTGWKTFYHSCGAVEPLIDLFIEAGADILNPVQCSAAGMDAEKLKAKYGDKLVFWGGGVDTQGVFAFGTPDEVREQVRERVRVFSPGGGFVFNTVHNIQANTPVENIAAMYDELAKIRGLR